MICHWSFSIYKLTTPTNCDPQVLLPDFIMLMPFFQLGLLWNRHLDIEWLIFRMDSQLKRSEFSGPLLTSYPLLWPCLERSLLSLTSMFCCMSCRFSGWEFHVILKEGFLSPALWSIVRQAGFVVDTGWEIKMDLSDSVRWLWVLILFELFFSARIIRWSLQTFLVWILATQDFNKSQKSLHFYSTKSASIEKCFWIWSFSHWVSYSFFDRLHFEKVL